LLAQAQTREAERAAREKAAAEEMARKQEELNRVLSMSDE